jgi:hypothetical protein
MGWITNRRNQTGRGIGGNPNPSRGPLRNIVKVLTVGTDMFSRDRVLLECGHEIYSNGIYKARCWKCKSGEPPIPGGK